ncbi:hypothetical protein [Rhodanobacter sp. B04]|uniref:hypothetical protein n=1 Tax=Rhodanobacter sp. B04 TaxID=1945860 RepID=UPI0011157C27|nr:hypothetical protein [Rhodanobacter sp. B04]
MDMTRTELKRLLAKLDQSMPALMKQYPEDHNFMPVFAHMADAITEGAKPDDYDWVNDEIDWILDKHGKLKGDYLPPANTT